jgi:hypothetical protein
MPQLRYLTARPSAKGDAGEIGDRGRPAAHQQVVESRVSLRRLADRGLAA